LGFIFEKRGFANMNNYIFCAYLSGLVSLQLVMTNNLRYIILL